MDEEMREKMISAFEDAVRVAGAKDYETGMMQARNLIVFVSGLVEFVTRSICAMGTIEGLRKMLDSMEEMSEEEAALLMLVLNQLPQLLRFGLMTVGKTAASTIPPPSGGRKPALTARQIKEALDYVSQLNRKGVSMPVAKARASQKFGCGLRTIERLWTNRESLPEDEPTMGELVSRVLKEVNLSAGWPVIPG